MSDRSEASALLEAAHELPGPEYWKRMRGVWENDEQDNPAPDSVKRRLLEHHPADRSAMMSDAERAHLAGLPQTVIVWRGGTLHGAESGFSWTTDKTRAEWFAEPYRAPGIPRCAPSVIEGRVAQGDLIAYLNDVREEHEVIAFPEDVTVTGMRDMSR